MQTMRNDKKVINGWAMFDWANSAFALVITTAIFPAYYVTVTFGQIDFFGREVPNSALYAFSISLAYLLIAAFSPLLSGIADYGGRKKFFLKFFTGMGSIACILLFFFKGMSEEATATQNYLQLIFGTTAFIVALIGFAGGLVFYNSYLPEIVTEDRYDNVSARGFAFGYIGSVLLLIANLIILTFPTTFGLPAEGTLPARIAFVMVGLWWIGFAQIPFRRLPPDPKNRPTKDLLTKGFEELQKVWQAVQDQKYTGRFLLSFFAYSAGVQTMLFLAATFAEKELGFDTNELIIIVLILQIVAIAGAYLFAKISEWQGNKISLIIMLLIWILICGISYFVYGKIAFYALAGAVGLVMGGIQSLSRSTYSKLLPKRVEDTTSYFSFYDVLEKVAIVIGTFSFGAINQLTGGMRNSVLAMSGFFFIGLVILLTVKIQHAKPTLSEQ